MGFLFHRADSRTVKGAEMSKWLTDKEKRILFSALTREKSVCIQVDKQCEPREPYEQSLQSVCESLEHKFYYDRLFKQMEKQIREEAIDDFASKLIMHFADWKLSNAPFNDDETDRIREIICETIENAIGGVKEIEEQLKAGVENDKSI